MSPATAPPPLPIDPGLLGRFRLAGDRIAWRAVPGGTPERAGRRSGATAVVRIAHLHDEEARVEETARAGRRRIVVDSGPVGALVLLLEADRRGPPSRLVARAAGELPAFTQGAIEAEWGGAPPSAPGLPLTDLVSLARYALG